MKHGNRIRRLEAVTAPSFHKQPAMLVFYETGGILYEQRGNERVQISEAEMEARIAAQPANAPIPMLVASR